jgi:hypothetical protein
MWWSFALDDRTPSCENARVDNRRSYSGLMKQPAWLLYDGKRLVASVRATTPDAARDLFKTAGLTGTHMRKTP